MPLTPGYGETPLPHDELATLLPEVVDVLDKPITRAAGYDLEQGLQDRVFDELMPAALDGSLRLDELLNDYFVRDLHTQLFGSVWNWTGRWRRLELNIGVAPDQIAVELRNTLDTIAYRWEHTDDWTPRQLGIVVHAETVRIHPFTDGNGRTTRSAKFVRHARVSAVCWGLPDDDSARPLVFSPHVVERAASAGESAAAQPTRQGVPNPPNAGRGYELLVGGSAPQPAHTQEQQPQHHEH